MSESPLVNRTQITTTMSNRLLPYWNQLAKTTRVPKTRLLDEAVEDLLRKYGIELPPED